jgi:hypothetical protein
MPSARPYNDATLFVSRINAGATEFYTDADGHIWEPDMYLDEKGDVYDQCPTEIRNTDNDSLYCNGRLYDILSIPQPYQYVIPVPRTGTYTVVLHFAELIHSTAGRRIFNILINNELVARQVDVVSAVGPNTAYSMSFTITISSSSSSLPAKIVLEFIPLRDSPMIAAMEIFERDTATDEEEAPTTTPTVSSNAPLQSILINCGGNNFIEKASRRIWGADQYFVGGNPYTETTISFVNNGVNETTLDFDLYQTERNGEFVYNIPVPSRGVYTVILHLLEFQYTERGQRQFTIDIENDVQQRYDNVDIVALGNGTAFQPITLVSSNIVVVDGFITIQLSHSVPRSIGIPKLSGIEIQWQ